MKRAEFTGNGPFAAFARQVCGIERLGTRGSEYDATADYAKAQDTGRKTAAE
jgi:4-hydroxyphenylacetate 3-monooxygenase/chlorophenol-4-monooxygenase component 2